MEIRIKVINKIRWFILNKVLRVSICIKIEAPVVRRFEWQGDADLIDKRMIYVSGCLGCSKYDTCVYITDCNLTVEKL